MGFGAFIRRVGDIITCMPTILVVSLLLTLAPLGQVTLAQETPLSGPFDSIIQQMQFDTPTRIAGRLVTFDTYDDAIWIEWTHQHDGGLWRPVRPGMQFKVFPRDTGMMDFFRTLTPGTVLRMIIQRDEEGRRRVLALDDQA